MVLGDLVVITFSYDNVFPSQDSRSARLTMALTPEQLVEEFYKGEISFDGAARMEPEIAWRAIVTLSRQPLTDKQIAVLAAGPIEDLLASHGEAFIDRVEREARVYPAFRHLLGGVWRNSISEPVCRINAIRGPTWQLRGSAW